MDRSIAGSTSGGIPRRSVGTGVAAGTSLSAAGRYVELREWLKAEWRKDAREPAAAAIFAEVGGIEPAVAEEVILYAIDRGAYSREISEEALAFALEQSKAGGAVPPEYTRADLDPLFIHVRPV